jgi:superoxide reductase
MKKGSPVFSKCNICGNITVKLVNSGVKMVCCGQPMEEMVPNTVDASVEKHVPVVTKIDDCTLKIEVGSAPHPMTPEHHIVFIYIETENGGEHVILDETGTEARSASSAEPKPEAEFCVCKDKPVAAYEYCNLHGLWKTEIK